MSRLFVIKIGGNVLDNPASQERFLKTFAAMNEPRILVHGGGKIATRIGDQLGIESRYVNGRRITDEATRDVVTMVYGGLVNKQIVASLQAMGCNAIGLTGADGNSIAAVKRPAGDTDFGYVGDVRAAGVNTTLLTRLLNDKLVPVFAPLTHADGVMLNTNADTIASVVAVSLSRAYKVRLVYCFEKKGVLKDVNDPESVIPYLPRSLYHELLGANALADGILPKLENAYAAIEAGVSEVLIGDAEDLSLNTAERTEGTLITA